MIYLDSAATTAVLPEVLDAMMPWFRRANVGNPSSIHTQGVKAREAVENARKQVADMIGASPKEIIFTSGGTESNNMWLKCFDGNVVLTTEVEHISVLDSLYGDNDKPRLIVPVDVEENGAVDLADLERKLIGTKGLCPAVSLMWVNNELGTVNPMREIGELCRRYNAFLFTDAIQAAGHIPIDVRSAGIDSLSIAGHKFGAPMGIGALYISSGIVTHSMIKGGGQEFGYRGGTENVPAIVGLGKAAEIATERMSKWRHDWKTLRSAFISEMEAIYPNKYRINGGDEYSNIISLTLPGVHSESLLALLDQRDIYLSAGSACNANSTKVSHVLKGIGMSRDDAACTVRISMGLRTTGVFNASVDEMVLVAHEIVDAARRITERWW